MNTRSANAFAPVALKTARRAVAAICVALGVFLAVVTHALADDAAKNRRDFTRLGSFDMQGVELWFRSRFTEAELSGYQPEDFSIEQHMCNCYDKPVPHYPYILMFFSTPKGDLVGRPERRGFDTIIIPLAERHGERYCEVGSQDVCFGTFAEPCDFSDFRYGGELAKYFPYCKTDEAEPS